MPVSLGVRLRRGLILAILLFLALLPVACSSRLPRLDAAAGVRLAQLQACDCANHDGWGPVSLNPVYFELTRWRGEVIAVSSQPLTLERSQALWALSPEHAGVLAYCPHFLGLRAERGG